MSDTPAYATTAELHEWQRTGKWPASALARRRIDTTAGETFALIPGAAPKRHKYNVGPRHLRQLDGYTFDSIAERKRYEVLRAMEKAGEICELRVHPCWPLVVEEVPIAEYEADFSYRHTFDGEPAWLVVEDVKGVRTAVYRMKRRLMEALYNIEVQEVDP